MKVLPLLILVGASTIGAGEIRMLPLAPAAAFGGARLGIDVGFENQTDRMLELEIHRQILQASSVTVAPVDPPSVWKRLTLLPHQTALDQATLEFPAVRGETRFLVRFTHGRMSLGIAEVWVYPSNILAALTTLLDGEPMMLVDVPVSLRDVLAAAKVDCLAVTDPPNPQRRRIALVGPASESSGGMAGVEAVRKFANTNMGVIWLKQFSAAEAATLPAYCAMNVGSFAVVVAQPQTLTKLATDPWAQLRLVRMARLAAGQEHFDLQPIIEAKP